MHSRFRVGPAPRKRQTHRRQQKESLQRAIMPETQLPLPVIAALSRQPVSELQLVSEMHPAPALHFKDFEAHIQGKERSWFAAPSPWGIVPYGAFSHLPREPRTWTPEICRVIEWYHWGVRPQFRPVFSVFGVFNIYEACMTRKWTWNVFQVWATTIVYTMARFLPKETNWPRYYAYHGQALSHLRQKIFQALARPVTIDEELIEMMLFLLNLSFLLGDPEMAEAHITRIRAVLAACGPGFTQSQVSQFTQCMASQWEHNWAMARTQPADLFIPQLPKYPARNRSQCTPFAVDKIPVGFQRLARNNRITLDTIEVVYRLTVCLRDVETTLTQPVNNLEKSDLRDFHSACPSLDSDTMTFERMLCLTLMVYSSIGFRTDYPAFDAFITFRGPRALVSLHLSKFSTRNASEEACVRWIWLVIIESWKAKDGTYDVTGLGLLAEYQKRYPGCDWHMVEETLYSYFWNSSFSKNLSPYWQTVN